MNVLASAGLMLHFFQNVLRPMPRKHQLKRDKMTKILVIETNLEERNILKDNLEAQNFEVIEATDGLAGIQKAQKYLPDIVICNVDIPNLNGYQVLKALRKDIFTIIIPLIFTGNGNKVEIRKGMILGADDYLVKPLNSSEILAAITSQLKKRLLLKQYFSFQFQPASCEILADVCKSKVDSKDNINPHTCSISNKVFNFIEAHYHEGISLRDVAESIRFTPTYLTKLVKRETGKTVNGWIIERRLTAACFLLSGTANSIESIAESVGYNNSTHFFQQFRKHYKMTPRVWRETNCTLSAKRRSLVGVPE